MKVNQPYLLRAGHYAIKTLLVLIILLSANGCKNENNGISDKSAISDHHDSLNDYKPIFWLQGISEKSLRDMELTETLASSLIDNVYEKGWRGVMYWGADREGAKMHYYFKSPFLEKQDWAITDRDGLMPLLHAAHKKGMKVVINLEDVNPYHWVKNPWTADNIGQVAKDLAKTGVDAVFEECFEVKPEVFRSLAGNLNREGVDYISGTDPMLLRESNFSTLWAEAGTVNIYNYYLKRDKIFSTATLAQNGSLGYGWARYWGKPSSLMSPLNRNWGMPIEYSPAIVKYLCMIRALQFRTDNFMIFGGLNRFDPVKTQSWIREYIDKQEKDRPLMDIVVLLGSENGMSGTGSGDTGWNSLFNSGDAITSGAMNAGYNIIVSDKVVPADAYWIYARGGLKEILPREVIALFDTDKPVFIQCGSAIPSGENLQPGWDSVLNKCGIDASRPFGNISTHGPDEERVSVLPGLTEDLPYTGYYNNIYLRFTGSDIQRGMDLRTGTVIPESVINGTIYCTPNKTYGRGPFIAGKDKKFVVTATTLNWEAAYPVSNLLSGHGILPKSNVWGIVGKNVTALLAIETTELEMSIPGLPEGSKIHVIVWDSRQNKKSEETVIYKTPFKKMLNEYDFILINKAG